MKTATLTALASTFLALPVLASPASTQVEEASHWSVDAFTLEVVTNDGAVPTADLMRAVEGAADAWNQTGIATQIVVVPAPANVSGGFKSDGHNTLSIVTSDWSGQPQAAALTMRAVDKKSDTILEVDTIVNFDRWAFCDGAAHGEIDLQSVLTHELGHTLGLVDDKEHDDATMFYGSRDNDVSKRTLASVDEQTLAAVYSGVPLDAGAVGCASTPAARGTDGSIAGAVILVGLASVVRRRHRGGTVPACAVRSL